MSCLFVDVAIDKAPIKDPLSAHIGDAMEMIPFSCSSRSKARPDFWISFSSMYNAYGEVCVLLE